MYFFALIFMLFIGYLVYIRYFPIKGIPCIDMQQLSENKANVKVDIRDYNDSSKGAIADSILMPVAYLRRYHNQIPSKQIYLIASDKIERNLAIRILKQKGYQVIGYTITKCQCPREANEII
ncbi:hypothetical protein [Paraliobacillus ryukyuensis]|uniref:hypothetical protein n=1 Tax=Paraliobacillus ryukyuensis TaxID=200904 RepID=UPI0009A67A0E|nr:hypothetical protein [Paraliobacillus ryukyuensis]